MWFRSWTYGDTEDIAALIELGLAIAGYTQGKLVGQLLNKHGLDGKAELPFQGMDAVLRQRGASWIWCNVKRIGRPGRKSTIVQAIRGGLSVEVSPSTTLWSAPDKSSLESLPHRAFGPALTAISHAELMRDYVQGPAPTFVEQLFEFDLNADASFVNLVVDRLVEKLRSLPITSGIGGLDFVSKPDDIGSLSLQDVIAKNVSRNYSLLRERFDELHKVMFESSADRLLAVHCASTDAVERFEPARIVRGQPAVVVLRTRDGDFRQFLERPLLTVRDS
jgi:hypothetical protein